MSFQLSIQPIFLCSFSCFSLPPGIDDDEDDDVKYDSINTDRLDRLLPDDLTLWSNLYLIYLS